MSRLRRDSTNDSTPKVTNGFTPGGHIPQGYSYLQRSHSLVTPTRRNKPSGMENVQSPSTSPRIALAKLSINGSASRPLLSRSKSSVSPLTERFAGSPPSKSVRRIDSCESIDSFSLGSPHDLKQIAELVSELPSNPKTWTSSQVGLYLTHVLGVTPKPVVDDLTAYVRRARMGGKRFLRLRERELAQEGVNLKWRKLMIEAVKKLRRDCLRSRILGIDNGIFMPSLEDDLEEEGEDEMLKEQQRKSDKYAQGTLKRLRDRKAVSGMITKYKSINETEETHENSSSPVGKLHRSQSVDFSSGHGGNGHESLSTLISKGLVKERAASLNDDRPGCRLPVSREQLESWFGELSDKEVEELEEVTLECDSPSSTPSGAARRSVSARSEDSASSFEEAITPGHEKQQIDLTPIDAKIVASIVDLPSVDEGHESQSPNSRSSELLASDRAQEADLLEAAQLQRKGASPRTRNPYRLSTYGAEEIAELGLDPDETLDSCKQTIKKIERGTKSAIEPRAGVSDLFSEPCDPSASRKPASFFSTLPYVNSFGISDGKRLTGNADHKMIPDGCPDEDVDVWTVPTREPARYVQDVEDDVASLGRSANLQSRFATLSRASVRSKGAVSPSVSKLSELFSTAENKGQTSIGEDVKEMEKHCRNRRESIKLPLLTFGKDANGNKSVRKKSMVLVDRRQYEELKRRFESNVEAPKDAMLPTSVDLADSYDISANHQAPNREVSTEEIVVWQDDEQSQCESSKTADNMDPKGAWHLPGMWGFVPSYALGFAAGAGFIVLSEILGARR